MTKAKCCNWQNSDGSCPKHDDEAPILAGGTGQFSNPHAAIASGVAFHTAKILSDCFPDAYTITEKAAAELGDKLLTLRIEFRSEDRNEVVAAFCDELLKFPVVAFVDLETKADDLNSEFRKVRATVRCDWALRGVEYNPLVMLTLLTQVKIK